MANKTKGKPSAENYIAPTQLAHGDNYGTGSKAPMGKFVSQLTPKSAKGLKIKPKKLA